MRYLFFILFIWSNNVFAKDSFYQDKTSGWFWYKDRVRAQEKDLNFAPTDLEAQVDFDKEELDRTIKIAIKNPTEQNLINFIKLRNKIMDQSYNFSLRLHQVNLMHPELDLLKTYPINQVSKEIYKQQKTENIEAKIADLSKTHGLFYIFTSRCPYCHAFATTVKNFANKYGWSLVPITLDGNPIPEFKDARFDNGAIRKLNITGVPALIMVEPKANKAITIAIGVISEEEIIERIDLLTRDLRT